jgi:hypothetical protein
LQHSRRVVLPFVLVAALFAGAAAIGRAECPTVGGVPRSSLPSAAPSASPGPVAFSTAMPGASANPVPSPNETPYVPPQLYPVADEIFTINRDTTFYYYFQENRDGTGKAKYEWRYGRNLGSDCAQIRLRVPVITKWPVLGNPYSGLGNLELGYGYYWSSKTFSYSLEFRVAAPTNANNVDNHDTELKGFYTTQWKWPSWALTYYNEYDQSIIKPPGSTWTSYYEGKLTIPDYKFAKRFKISAFWNYRILFDTGGIFKDALGTTIFGGYNWLALSFTDSWGLGANALWKYKFEANATAKF